MRKLIYLSIMVLLIYAGTAYAINTSTIRQVGGGISDGGSANSNSPGEGSAVFYMQAGAQIHRAYFTFKNEFLNLSVDHELNATVCVFQTDMTGTADPIGLYEFNQTNNYTTGFKGLDEHWNNNGCGTGFTNAAQCNLTPASVTIIDGTDNKWFCFHPNATVKKAIATGQQNISFMMKFVTEGGTNYHELGNTGANGIKMWVSGTVGSVTPTTPPNITLTATDDFNSITNFSAMLSQSGSFYNYTTGNGTILVTDRTNGFYDIKFSSNQSGGFFNRTYLNVFVNGTSLQGLLWQAVIYVNATDLFGNQLLSFGAIANRSLNINNSNSTGFATLRVNAGSYNVVGNITGYLNSSAGVNVTNRQEKYVTLQFFNSQLRIDAKSLINGSYLSRFSIRINSSAGYSNNASTTTGNISFFLANDTYYMTFSSDEYSTQNASVSFASGNFYPNYTFNVYTSNSFNFTFFDEKNLSRITQNVSVQLISDFYSNNYTATSGVLYTDLITPGIYLIRFSAQGYPERHYYFNLANNTNNQLSLYMITQDLVDDVIATIIDQINDPVEGAYIKVLRYELPLNAYTLREIYKTDVQGEAQLNIIKNDEFYQFIIEQPFGTIKLVTDPAYIIQDDIFFQILFTNLTGDRFFNSQDIAHDLTFNNVTNTFRLIYSDPNNLMSELCLNVYKQTLRAKTLVNQSCLTTASGTIILGVSNESGVTFVAEALVGFSPTEYVLDVESWTYRPADDLPKTWGNWINLFLTITAGFAGFMSLPIMIILVTLPTLFLSMFGIIQLDPLYGSALTVAAVILSAIVRKYS